MKHYTLIIFLFFSLSGFFLNGQTEHEKYGCMYLKSKIKMRDFTSEELSYAHALEFRSDTFDVVNYRIRIDVTDFNYKILQGRCDIDFFSKISGMNYITFDLLEMKVDSVKMDSEKLNFDYKSPFLKIFFDKSLEVNDTLKVSVYYNGKSKIDPSGFGGFYFENNYAYNLGIGLSSIPHNYGRSWFPCFDNFVERSTYDFDIITKPEHFAYSVGNQISIDTLNTGKKVFHFRMNNPIATYHAGIAVSDYREINWNYEGLDKNIPIQLVGKPQDTTKMKTSFAYLPFAIEAFEKWYGSYPWDRVGYAMTTVGAMEHPTNIAFPDFLGNNGNPDVAMEIMAHELAHHWWGDLTTLTTAHDMWIKEGTSEYGMHQFIEHFFGEEKFKEYLKENSLEVINKAHITDKEYRALSGMPMEFTYGPTTYNKGAMVIHNLRTYMGDSLFTKGMRLILKEYAYSHLDAAQFQAELEKSTGLDLNCFFNNWIKSPGFTAFEIDSVKTKQEGDKTIAEVFIEQKIHHAPDFYCNVPLEITFYDTNNLRFDTSVMVSGRHTNQIITLPFTPNMWIINENQKLNISQLGGNYIFKKDKTYALNREKITIKTPGLVQDSVQFRVEHTWGSPDPKKTVKPEEKFKISNSHYWTITGNIPENNNLTASFFYNGSKNTELDFDLTNLSEDSILVAYRPDSKHEWQIHPSIQKQKLIPKDGKGNLIITGLYPGQYAFANYAAPSTSVKEIYDDMYVYPNPTDNSVFISFEENIRSSIDKIHLLNINGDVLLSRKYINEEIIEINTYNIIPGIYLIQSVSKESKNLKTQKIVIE
jgi:aminopeptidase N